jgi:hypothetical protein
MKKCDHFNQLVEMVRIGSGSFHNVECGRTYNKQPSWTDLRNWRALKRRQLSEKIG